MRSMTLTSPPKIRGFKLYCFIAVFVVISLFLVAYEHISKAYLQHQLDFNNSEYFVHTKGCRIRRFYPFDRTIAQYYWQQVSPLNECNKPSYLEVVNNRIYLNKSKVQSDFGDIFVECFYQSIGRPGEDSEDYPDLAAEVSSKRKTLKFGKFIKHEYLKIECLNNNNSLFVDYLTLLRKKPEIENTRAVASRRHLSPERLNVIMVAIDSISKLNFLRHFSKTYAYLHSVLKPFEFHGHNKVADNTFVNMVPMLTGHFVSYYRSVDNMSNTYYDDLDFIWKEYQAFGYRTLYAEDCPTIGTFTYNKLGFENQPTDYSLRPLALAVESEDWKTKYGEHCFGHTSEVEFYYGYLKKFLKTMSKKPMFSFTFVSRISHDYLNQAGYADEPTFELFKDLYESGTLNRSALIFFSDHGIRFGDILDTYVGKIEERMPFMFQYYPEWFLKKHPGLARNLTINQHRLTTPFDVHKTLQNLLALSSKNGANPYEEKNPGNGMSLFNEIPTDRTCEDANIAPHWCTCHDHFQIPNNSREAMEAAKAIVRTLNSWTQTGGYEEKCAELFFEEVMDAYATVPLTAARKDSFEESDNPLYVPEGLDNFYYLITLKVTPSGGRFEGTVQDKGGNFTVFGELGRVNMYGNQSWCVDDTSMKKFCYCKEPFRG